MTQDRIQRRVLISKMLSRFMEAERPAMWMECPQGSRHESELCCRSGLLTPAAWFSGSSNLATAPAATDQSKPRSFEMWQIVITYLKNYDAIKYEKSFIWVWNSVSHIQGKAMRVLERGAEEDSDLKDSNTKLEKLHKEELLVCTPHQILFG